MKLTVSFKNAVVYDFKSLEVANGEVFKITTDSTQAIQWFSDNDAVCDITVNPEVNNEANFVAKSEGTTTILFVSNNQQIVHSVVIEVKNLVSLNPTASTPELKP